MDSGVDKSLMARKQYKAVRRANPHMRVVSTSTRFVAYRSHHRVPLLGKTRICLRNQLPGK